MSSPIAIPAKHSPAHYDDIASSASSSTNSMLYVPLHKRDSSPVRSTEEHGQGFGMYTRDFLLSLQRSPLARLDAEKKDHLRSVFPEIAMNRKMRKSLEYHAAMHEKAMKAAAVQGSSPSPHHEAFHHPHPHHENNHNSHHNHSPRPHSPQHHQPKDSHTHTSHARLEETSPTYNPFSPLAPHARNKQPKPDLRSRGRSAAARPERRRYAFGLKMRHGDLDSAVTWRGAGAGRIGTAPSVVAV